MSRTILDTESPDCCDATLNETSFKQICWYVVDGESGSYINNWNLVESEITIEPGCSLCGPCCNSQGYEYHIPAGKAGCEVGIPDSCTCSIVFNISAHGYHTYTDKIQLFGYSGSVTYQVKLYKNDVNINGFVSSLSVLSTGDAIPGPPYCVTKSLPNVSLQTGGPTTSTVEGLTNTDWELIIIVGIVIVAVIIMVAYRNRVRV